jgi:hypothetical protein
VAAGTDETEQLRYRLSESGNAEDSPADTGEPAHHRFRRSAATILVSASATRRSSDRTAHGASFCGSSEGGRLGSASPSDRGTAADAARETSHAGRCRVNSGCYGPTWAGGSSPRRNALPTSGRLRALVLWPRSRVVLTPERRAVNSRAGVGGCGMLRPDVADIRGLN